MVKNYLWNMAAKVETQILDLLKSIKQDTEYIKLKMNIEEVGIEELTEEERRDLKEALKDLKEGKAVKIDEL